MQEIVTLACEKWAAGDKVSLVFCHLQILSLWDQVQNGVVKSIIINNLLHPLL